MGKMINAILKYGIPLKLIFTPMMEIPQISVLLLTRINLVIKLIIIGAWLIKKFIKDKTRELPKTPFNLFIFGFLILAIFSSFFSIDYKSSFKGLRNVFEVFCFFYIFLENINDRKYINKIIALLLILGGLEGLYALIQFIVGFNPNVKFLIDVHRSSGSFNHPNTLAMYLTQLLLIATSIFLFTKKKHIRLMLGFSILTMLCGLFCSNSRGGILSFIVALLAISLIKFRWVLKWYFALFVLFFGFWSIYSEGIKEYLRVESGWSYRDEAWAYALEMIKERPLLGSGLGTATSVYYNKTFSNRGGTIENEEFFSKRKQQLDKLQPFLHAHNTYFNYAVEMGVLAPILFFVFLIIYYRMAFNLLKSMEESYWQALIVGFIGVIIGFSVYCFFDNIPFYGLEVITLPIMLFVALTVIIGKIIKNEASIEIRPNYFG